MEKILNYIDGKFVEPAAGNFFDNINPALGKHYGIIHDSDSKDVANAVAAAKSLAPVRRERRVQPRLRPNGQGLGIAGSQPANADEDARPVI